MVQNAYAEMVNRSAWAVEMTDAELDTMLPLHTHQVHCLSPYGIDAADHIQLHPQRRPSCVCVVSSGNCCLSYGNASSDANAAMYQSRLEVPNQAAEMLYTCRWFPWTRMSKPHMLTEPPQGTLGGGPWLWVRPAYSRTVRVLSTKPATAHVIILGSGVNGDVL